MMMMTAAAALFFVTVMTATAAFCVVVMTATAAFRVVVMTAAAAFCVFMMTAAAAFAAFRRTARAFALRHADEGFLDARQQNLSRDIISRVFAFDDFNQFQREEGRGQRPAARQHVLIEEDDFFMRFFETDSFFHARVAHAFDVFGNACGV